MNEELSTENAICKGKVMTILEVANVLGKDSSTIRKIGKELFPYSFKNGRTTFLNEEQVTAIKLNLGKNSELPKTDLEKEMLIQQAMMFQAEKIQSMKTRLEIAEPKARLADEALRDKSKHYCIRDAGKHIGLPQKQIFEILRENQLLTKKNLPSQKAMNLGLLSLRTNVVEGKNRPQAVLTMENILNFKERYCKNEKEDKIV